MTHQTDPDRDTDVLIVGAGPVGLSLAIGLARRGVRSLVLDRKAALDTHSRAIALFPRTLEIFREFGVLDGLLAEGERGPHLRLRRASDRRTLIDFDFAAMGEITRCNFVLAIPQDRTEKVLLAAAYRSARVEVAFSATFLRFEAPDGADAVRAAYRDASGREVSVRARYLVGADGAHSAVRAQLGWELEGKTYAGRAMLADVEVAAEADAADGWLAEPDRPSLLMSIRYAPRTWRLIEQGVPDALSDADLPDRARVLTEALFGPGAWRSTLWTSVYRKHERMSPRFRRGRVLLAGDAAHLNSPAGGQGLNTGTRDAHNLAWKLELALHGGGDAEALLSSYEAEQQDAFRNEVAPLTDTAERLQTAPQWARKVAFRALLPLARRLGVMERAAARHSMLFVDLGRSPLLTQDGNLVGRRLPDLKTPQGPRLHDLIGRKGLVLHRPGIPDSSIRGLAAIARGLEMTFAPMPRSLDGHGFLGADALYVRPDQIVGLQAGRSASLSLAGVRAAAGLPLAVLAPEPAHAAARAAALPAA